MPTNPDLAALSEAATQSTGAWKIYLLALDREYRAGRLAQIDREGMLYKAVTAIDFSLAMLEPDTRAHGLTLAEKTNMASLIIGAILGEG